MKNEIKTADRETVAPDVIYKNNIFALVDDVKGFPQFQNKSDDELKNDKAFFPSLVNYIYNNYIGELLGNKYGRQVVYKDIQQLDDLFNIYIELVYKYKWNNRPILIEYGLLTGIRTNTFYNWLNGSISDDSIGGCSDSVNGAILTRERSDTVQKWIETCERALIDGTDTIKDIFILKSKHGYRDNNNDINVTVRHQNVISADVLPALIDLKTQ